MADDRLDREIVGSGIDVSSGEFPYDERFATLSAAVGRVASQWAAIEFALNEIIWMLSDSERAVGACVTAQFIGSGPRFRAIVALMERRGAPPGTIKAMNVFSREIEALAARRNRIVHDPWSLLDSGEFARLQVTADRKLTYQFEPMTVQEVNALYIELVTALAAVMDMHDRLIADLPPWNRNRFTNSPGIATNRGSEIRDLPSA